MKLTKVCNGCKIGKSSSEFYKRKNCKGGLSTQCKACEYAAECERKCAAKKAAEAATIDASSLMHAEINNLSANSRVYSPEDVLAATERIRRYAQEALIEDNLPKDRTVVYLKSDISYVNTDAHREWIRMKVMQEVINATQNPHKVHTDIHIFDRNDKIKIIMNFEDVKVTDTLVGAIRRACTSGAL